MAAKQNLCGAKVTDALAYRGGPVHKDEDIVGAVEGHTGLEVTGSNRR